MLFQSLSFEAVSMPCYTCYFQEGKANSISHTALFPEPDAGTQKPLPPLRGNSNCRMLSTLQSTPTLSEYPKTVPFMMTMADYLSFFPHKDPPSRDVAHEWSSPNVSADTQQSTFNRRTDSTIENNTQLAEVTSTLKPTESVSSTSFSSSSNLHSSSTSTQIKPITGLPPKKAFIKPSPPPTPTRNSSLKSSRLSTNESRENGVVDVTSTPVKITNVNKVFTALENTIREMKNKDVILQAKLDASLSLIANVRNALMIKFSEQAKENSVQRCDSEDTLYEGETIAYGQEGVYECAGSINGSLNSSGEPCCYYDC